VSDSDPRITDKLANALKRILNPDEQLALEISLAEEKPIELSSDNSAALYLAAEIIVALPLDQRERVISLLRQRE
jgi:hypothetical protein